MLDVRLLQERLNAYCVATLADPEPRWHLGASEIGDDCTRRVWLKFRWAKQEYHDGTRLRLFKRGHYEEPRLAALLEAIGVKVVSFDELGKQHKFSGVMGHFGGARDGLGTCDLIPGVKFIVEYKTHGDKYYRQFFAKDGTVKSVRTVVPKHFRQMCAYGKAAGVEWALYVALNKNTDEIHFEWVALDPGQADADLQKAEHIITAQTPFPRISATPTFYKCKMCFLSDICHNDAPIDINCRSCVNAHAMPGGEWYCAAYQRQIPRDFVPVGCPSWRAIL